MGILTSAINKRTYIPDSLPLTDAAPWRTAGIIRSSDAGVTVNEETALTLSAVYRAVDLLSNHFAMLPAGLYERVDDRTRRRADNHALDPLIRLSPNSRMNSFNWRKVALTHLLLWGNHYSQIVADRRGRIEALWPLFPGRMQRIFDKDGIRFYEYRSTMGKITTLPEWEVFHWRGFTLDGFLGLSVVSHARQSLGLGLASERFGARFFGNDARPSVVLEHPGELGEVAQKNITQSFTETYGGGNSWGFMVLEEGMKLNTVTMPLEDAQFLETRRFQVSDVARWFGVPPHKLAEMGRATFNNIEHMGIEYVQDSLQPHATNFEQTVDTQLLTQAERRRYYAKMSLDGLLRGDSESRHTAYQSGLNSGYYSINDVRELEDLNPVPGGDDYRVPLNTAPVGSMAASGDEEETPPPVVRSKEERAMRSGQNRHALRNSFVSIFADAIGRILRREANDVGNKAKSLLSKDDGRAVFEQWLDGFYEEHQGFIFRALEPIYVGYADQVARIVGREVGSEVPAERLSSFVKAYIATYAIRHAARQRARALELLEEQELLDAIEREMELWRDESRASGFAIEEATRLNNAVAIMMFTAAGIIYKRWLAFGDSCPYCTALNGQVVRVEFNFLEEGQSFMPPGALEALAVKRAVGHPPAHAGCDCMIVAG
jgi:HK97 family phage portal protein